MFSQEKVLGTFGSKTMKEGEVVEQCLPHAERSKRANIRGVAKGKPPMDRK